MYKYEFTAEMYYMGKSKVDVLELPDSILSIDRLSTIRYKIANYLKADPYRIYVEVVTED